MTTPCHVAWKQTYRVIRSRFPPISLFEDIADPADWEAIASAESKTNPRIRDEIGNLALVPVARRIAGHGASWVMAPFTHVSTDRPTRFSDGSFGVYYAGDSLAVALLEVAHHHGRFMMRTHEEPGWTSGFRQLIGSVQADLHDALTAANRDAVMAPNDWFAGQALGAALRAANANGIVYPSVRCSGGRCVALFWPDVAGIPVQGAHFALEWNGERVTRIQNLNTSELLAV